MKSTLLILCFVTVTFGQQSVETKRMCTERAEKIAETLETTNPIRNMIKKGKSGNCIHQSWMDKMQQFGVKQASFLVEYNWKKGKVEFKIKAVSFYLNYFSDSGDSEIKDKKILREIEASGLEQELRNEVIVQAKNSGFATYEKGNVKKDVFTAHLFDDEALPTFYAIT